MDRLLRSLQRSVRRLLNIIIIIIISAILMTLKQGLERRTRRVRSPDLRRLRRLKTTRHRPLNFKPVEFLRTWGAFYRLKELWRVYKEHLPAAVPEFLGLFLPADVWLPVTARKR